MTRWAVLVALAVPVTSVCVAPCLAADPLPVEKITIAKMPPDNGHRLYLSDSAIAHVVDGKIKVIDGDSFRILGMFSNGSFGAFNTSADGHTLYNAATYFSRGDHGARTEVLEFYDSQSLLPTGEVILPTKRAQDSGVRALMAPGAKGEYFFLQNSTPASSVTVVDLAHHKVIADIPTAGCFGVYPSASEPARFSTLCGDGAVVTIGFDAKGKETERRRSAVLFDPDSDPIYIATEPDHGKNMFLSYLGNVHVIDMSGPVATQEKPWSVTAGIPHGSNWRPGGMQPFAFSQATGALYVAMHSPAVEGGHKQPATEIWRLDTTKHAVTARVKSEGAIGLEVTADANPLLFAVNSDPGNITRFNGATLGKLGDSPMHILEYDGAITVK